MKLTAETFSINRSSPLQDSAAFTLVDSKAAAAAAATAAGATATAAAAAAAEREAGGCAASQGSPPAACDKAVASVARSGSYLPRQRAAVSLVTVAAAAAAFAAAAPAAGRESEIALGKCLEAAAATPALDACTSKPQTLRLKEGPTLSNRAAAASSLSSRRSNSSSSRSSSRSRRSRSSSRSSSSSSSRSSSSRSSSATRNSGRPVHECGDQADPQHSETLVSSPLLQTMRSWGEAYCPPAPQLKPQAAPLDLLMEELLEDAHLLPSLTEAAAAAEGCDAQQQLLLGSCSAAPYGERLLPLDWGTIPDQWGSSMPNQWSSIPASNALSQQLVEALANWSLRA
ncbi:hypothetical protein ACSSS7_001539 [Eimeria intestinalis]